jgi:arylsulfatase
MGRLKVLWAILLVVSYMGTGCSQEKKPNVIVIITDDQGYGDLGYTGNPHVKTPHIDKFAGESIRLNNFYVSPVCAPTRSSLMTGRYSLRTGVRDTYNGGATMATEEVTIAEMLKKGGYQTGMFGKWHLGDTYPHRPIDQGFEESVIHLAGGMGQVGDFTTYFEKDRSYYDPVLWHNGKQEAYEGYCSDIFADQAIDFVEKNKDNPFFCYLSFNAPHTPLQVPDKYYNMYKDIDPASGFEKDDRPFVEMSEKDKEDARKVYAMVTNIDENVGKLLEKLKELEIEDNTIVIFMTDNGPQQVRYVAGMRGRKGNVFQGGVRVPFYMQYPAKFKKEADIDVMAAHIDILPTLADLCQVPVPTTNPIDGKNLVPLLNGKGVDWTDRSLFFYWTRRYPELYNNIALQKSNFKLVGHTNYNAQLNDFNLFNLKEDPYEQNNLINDNPKIAADLKGEIDGFYKELINSKNIINPPRIVVGSVHENPVYLSRNDADGERGIWNQEDIYGFWKVKIMEGTYNFKYKFLNPLKPNGKMYLETNAIVNQLKIDKEDLDVIEMKNVKLPEMECDLIPFYYIGSQKILPFWVEIEKIN